MTTQFTEISLSGPLQKSLATAGYVQCTPIQEMTLPESLLGHDLIGVAKTGTGKTAAFLIPILQALEPGGDPQALVICPTRELALQVGGEAEKLGAQLGVRTAVLYGGTSLGGQKQQLMSGVDLVVGTPGRLLDFMTQAYLAMRRIRWLVLDEADRMLDMGFIDDVDKILRRVPMSRQTMLFSATLPKPVLELAHRYMLYPKEFRIDPGTKVPDGIEQIFYRAPAGRKVDLLRAVLRVERPHKVLIFSATKVATSEVARRLRSDGMEVYPISSNLRQADRERVLAGFRDGSIRALVATDVAARGIDIDDISHVVNLDLPSEPEDYVHRVGRTGRVDRLGRAISLVERRDEPALRGIETLLGQHFELGEFEGFSASRGGEAGSERGARHGAAGAGHERGGSSRRREGGAGHDRAGASGSGGSGRAHTRGGDSRAQTRGGDEARGGDGRAHARGGDEARGGSGRGRSGGGGAQDSGPGHRGVEQDRPKSEAPEVRAGGSIQWEETPSETGDAKPARGGPKHPTGQGSQGGHRSEAGRGHGGSASGSDPKPEGGGAAGGRGSSRRRRARRG